MPKHTPGPWLLHKYSATTVQNSAGRTVASCGGYQDNTSDGAYVRENEANALLVSLLPELVEALRGSTEWLEAVLAAMDKYNEANGTYIIGPSLLGSGRQVAFNRALLAKIDGDEA
jgi:hypothetical protein